VKVVYLPYQEGTEEFVLNAYLSQEDGVVSINDSKLTMPVIVNVTPFDLTMLKKLGNIVYKWVNEFRTSRGPSDAALDRFGFRVQRIVKSAKKSGMDILVIYDPLENIDLIRDELKRWVRIK